MLEHDEKQEIISLFEKLKQETILRYSDEIEYDADLNFYDVMMRHFVSGDLDDVFVSNVVLGMSDDEKKDLFSLTRKYNNLCFYKGDPLCWLDSVENALAADYDLIAYVVIDNYNYLLRVAKDGGRTVLEQLRRLSKIEALKESSIIDFVRNSFIDDNVLATILLDMSKDDSLYDIFTDEEKVALLSNPEGTLYHCFKTNELKILSPLLLGAQLYNEYTDDYIDAVDENNNEELVLKLGDFFSSDLMVNEFSDMIFDLSSRYRDYILQKGILIDNDNFNICYDITGNEIQDAWNCGDGVLGGSFETFYSSNSK